MRTSALASLFVLLVASEAFAQPSPPVVTNARPSRYVLTQGAVVEGVQTGEDAEYFVVRTANGDVRIRKVDIARIEFVGPVGPRNQDAPPASPAPVSAVSREQQADDEAEDRREAEKAEAQRSGAFYAGVLGFGTVYGLTVLGAAIGSFFDPEAAWLYIPLAGPLLYAKYGGFGDDGWVLLGALTFFQGGSALALLVGAIIWAASSDPEPDASLDLGGAHVAMDGRGWRLSWLW